ncbi:hypothetical protein GOP47_0002227 [Adiantum capillus-veneris]|uniref:Uncharacterized protein n=1 Tax=Adiantum capillus-veneris TaxID=13818 RepID=A0A9D4VA05_ADICA|nr:hypothetical protein GOP47_0001508 [Adiantum capillus-veneris]KAI5082484.1 hypothetical protein GOP47_0002227 [Adiantum capillus-veneris]
MGPTSLALSIKFAVLPIAKVLIICSLGFLLATRRLGVLSPSGNKLLSKLVFVLFLPCLIITELGAVITLQKMIQWWFIPVNVLVAAVIGCIIGCIVVLIVRPPQEFVKLTIVMIGIGNIGNIPLVLVGSVCRDPSNFFGDADACTRDGVAYISFGQWVGAIIVYTFAYHMLSPPEETVSRDRLSNVDSSLTVRILEGEEDHDQAIMNTSQKDKWWKTKMMQFEQVAKALHLGDIFQPPVSSSIIALIIGATPMLKNLLLADGAPLSFLTDSMSILGNAMIPCILLALGGNLEGGPGSSKLGLRTTIAITLTRLFIMPPVGMGVVALADKLGFLPAGDRLFRFVLHLQHTMPSSILAGAVAAMHGVAQKEASSILFWEHITAIVSITIWLIVYFNIIF